MNRCPWPCLSCTMGCNPGVAGLLYRLGPPGAAYIATKSKILILLDLFSKFNLLSIGLLDHHLVACFDNFFLKVLVVRHTCKENTIFYSVRYQFVWQSAIKYETYNDVRGILCDDCGSWFDNLIVLQISFQTKSVPVFQNCWLRLLASSWSVF